MEFQIDQNKIKYEFTISVLSKIKNGLHRYRLKCIEY